MDTQKSRYSLVEEALADEQETESDEGSLDEGIFRAEEGIRPYQFEPEYDESDNATSTARHIYRLTLRPSLTLGTSSEYDNNNAS